MLSETAGGAALLEEIRHRARGWDAEVLVVFPPEAAARERLSGLLDELAAAGIRACGRCSDGDPLAAIAAAVERFDADELILATAPHGRSGWVERRVVTRARTAQPVPVSHVVVDLEYEAGRAAEMNGW